MNRLLELALKIRDEEHMPFDIILDEFIDSLDIWKEYIYINLASEYTPNTKESIKKHIKFLKQKLKNKWYNESTEKMS